MSGLAQFIALMVGRVGSSSRAMSCRRCAIAAPSSPVYCSPTSLPTLQSDDRRMVAVATQHRAQILLVPVGEDQVEVERCLLALPRIEDFVDHQQAHAVGELQQLRRRRVVAHAHRVRAHVAQDFQLALRRAHVEGRAQRTEVVMVVDAVDDDALAVDEHALLRIEAHGADAETGFVAIDDAAAARHAW